jgi:DNA-binding CsgD family transcriptional regulator
LKTRIPLTIERTETAAGQELFEREGELTEISGLLEQVNAADSGRLLSIEGPAGVGKTALIEALEAQAGADRTLFRARGSELERDFGFGVVRQLFAQPLAALGAEEAARLFSGPASLAAPIFGLADPGTLEVGPAEGSLYGLYWLVVGLAERGPLVLSIDDAHWSDAASLRFVRYLSRRLDGLRALIVLAARPHEPGVQAEMLHGLAEDAEPVTVRPAPLSEAGTAALLRARLGAGSTAFEEACHEATGGNPFLVHELIAELDLGRQRPEALLPERVAAMGPERIAESAIERARRLDPLGPEVVRAVAVLGDGANLGAVSALVEGELARVAAIVDGLAAATILVDAPGHRFVHPLLRSAVYDAMPSAARSVAHARAAGVLAGQGAEPEEIAAHLLLCEPGAADGALGVLDAAAHRASARGATESAATYLRRALPEAGDGPARAGLLHRLGSAEVVLRDPGSLAHLGEAAALVDDPEQALDISLELIEVLFIAGQWDAAVAACDAAAARVESTGLPALLELEGNRAAGRGYDRELVAEYERDLPHLLALVEGRRDDESSRLRWVLAALSAVRGEPRELVLDLLGPVSTEWVVGHGGRETSLITHAVLALLLVEALDDGEQLAAALLDDGRRRGALLAIVAGLGFEASREQMRGGLGSAEANLNTAIELLRENDLSLMALATSLNFCLDAIVERRALEPVFDLAAELEVPPPLAKTFWGGMALEVQGAVSLLRGDRPGAVARFRAAEEIYRPLRISPRFSPWRSRLALALAPEQRSEAVSLAEEELALAVESESPRAVGVALRTLGTLGSGEAGIERLRESVAVLRTSPARLELARSLAELGAALRRGNRRSEAREQLREAADLAQLCGAERLEERVQEELRVAGARPRRRAISGAGSLTPAERRVADAAATGASNREIAQLLFVSLRTVEMHLTNAYRKLGISSRGELAAALSARPEPAAEDS